MNKFIETYGERPDGHGGLPTMTTRAQDTWDALRVAYEIGLSESNIDPHIDGVVPVQMTDAERGFLNGMLIGNLRRIYAAHDDEGNDLSALPSRAADEIERMQGHVADEYEEAMQELDKYGIPRADGDGPIFTLRGRMLRFLVRMTSNA